MALYKTASFQSCASRMTRETIIFFLRLSSLWQALQNSFNSPSLLPRDTLQEILSLWSSDALWSTWSFTMGPKLTLRWQVTVISTWDQTKLGLSEHQIQILCNLTILCWHLRVLCGHLTIFCQSSWLCGTHGPSTMLVQIQCACTLCIT